MKKLVMLGSLAVLLWACNSGSQKPEGNTENFKYLVDEFADIKIIRYQIPDWDQLSLQQKEYIYYLGEAAKCGRDILWDQNFKYNLVVRKTLENILATYKGDKTTDEYQQFLVYAKRVFFSNGIHHHYAEDKFKPDFSETYFHELMKNSDNEAFPVKAGMTVEEFTGWIANVIFNEELYKVRKSSDKSIDFVAASSVNFYENVTKKEVEEFYGKMECPNDPTPISYGLNSKLVKRNGEIFEDVYKLDGLYGEAIKQIVFWLEKAMNVAETEAQKNYTALLIEYYKTGDLKTWDDYNIAWVQDTEPMIDYVNGFIEDYGDPMGMKATWEAVVNFKDLEATKLSAILSDNAQWFEDNSPIDQKFKKDEVKGVSIKAITATTLGGDCFPNPPIGINLPNASWIRKDYGSKSVTITNLLAAYDKSAEESPKSVSGEFIYAPEELELSKQYGAMGSVLHTDLHELGHGTGQLMPGVSPNALSDNSSSLEEARADLFALYYVADPKLVELGIIPSLDVAKAEYNRYIRNGIMTQFTRIELGKDVTQAHMQGRKLIATWAYELGKDDNVIEQKIKDGKTYFVVNDYDKLRAIFGKQLAEIQRIKSEGDYAAGKYLIDNYAVKIDPILHKEVRERYQALDLKPYAGFMNTNIVPVKKGGKVVDYVVEYPMDFIQQHLEYGQKYGFLRAW
ncbi:MAG: dipeptidyl peptidase 3 [Bacteroidales bacterium]|nr:dipeptidyl peptidase 3 [Bacteroidales bacterium]